MSKHDEMTRYAFISHMEDYMKKLISNPLKADTDEFLRDHGIEGPIALKMLLKRTDPSDETSAVIIRTEKIKDNGTDENGKRLPDSFTVKYKIPRKDYSKKMRNLYINMFESNIVDGCPINEEDGGGAISGGDGYNDGVSTFSVTPQENALGDATPKAAFPIVRKKMPTDESKNQRTVFLTEEQVSYIKQKLEEEAEMDTAVGNFGYDVPAFNDKKFAGKTLNHKNICGDGGAPPTNENTIHIKKENEGKFTATKKKTGKSTEELTHSKNPLTRKRAIFAQNAKKWNHKK